jgi:hypothetical protein
MVYIGSKDLSPKLQTNFAISYLFYLYLMLHVYVQRFDVMEREWKNLESK